MRRRLFALLLFTAAALNATTTGKVAYVVDAPGQLSGPIGSDFLISATGSDATALIAAITQVTSLGECGYVQTGSVFGIHCTLFRGYNFESALQGLGYTVDPAGYPTFAATALTLGSGTSSTTGILAVPIESWTVTSSDSWLTLANASGTGNGNISLSYSANTSTYARTATLSVSGTNQGLDPNSLQQITITQSGATPVYAFASPSASVGAGAGTGTIGLTVTPANAAWSATSNQSWLTVSPAYGIGTTTLTYSYSANASSSPQTATISVGAASFSVTQVGAVTFSPATVTVPQAGGSGGVSMTTGSTTPWTAINNAAWLTVAPNSGVGSTTLTYSFSANNSTSARTGTINVNGVLFTVNQPGIVVTLSPSTVTIGGGGTTGTVGLTLSVAGASWTATSSASWLTVSPSSGSGNATLTYTVASNNSVSARSAYITVNGTAFLVNQNGLPGSVSISPVSTTVQQGASSGTITVTPMPTDYIGWTVTGAPAWLTLTFSGNSIMWVAAANGTGLNRLATLSVGGQTFSLMQTAIGATNPVVSGVTSAGSYATGAVAPGEIVTLFGVVLGPNTPSGLILNNNGTVATTNGQTQVFFDAIPAPIISAFGTQTNVQVPYGLSGQATTNLSVKYNGALSSPTPLAVTASAFSLFTHDSSGSGQGAVLNQDLSLNSLSNPATRGSVIVLYGTGEGQTNPPGVEGTISALVPSWLVPALPVSVTIGGQPATVQFAGEAPGEVSGLLQINVTVPASAPTGAAVPVIVTVGVLGITGASSSQANVTVAVK